MYIKTITYTDFNGVERKETFMFRLSKAELTEMELTTTGGLASYIQGIVDAKDGPSIIKLFKELLLKSYGQKSADGRRFIKSAALAEEFAQTEAYSELFMMLATDTDEASKFVNGIMPETGAKGIPAPAAH